MRKKSLILLVALILVFSGIQADARTKVRTSEFGIGIGIPYGGIGLNAEVGSKFVFTAGLGIVPFSDASDRNTQMGWCTGIKYYLTEPVSGLKLRTGLLWGSVAYSDRQTKDASGANRKAYDLLTGFAPIIGLRGENWDFDVAFPLAYSVPDNANLSSGRVMFSFGFRF
ncbi:MAG: hypothetical protein V2A78_05180 [bacterium]